MKTLFCLVVLAISLVSYGQSPKEITVTTNPASFHPPASAFGFNLGEKLPSTYEIDTNNICLVELPPTNGLPFKVVVLDLLPDHRIYEIFSGAAVDKETVSTLIKTLKAKYGLKKIKDRHYIFGTDERSIDLIVGTDNDVTFQLMDLRLMRELADQEEAHRKKANADLKEQLNKNF